MLVDKKRLYALVGRKVRRARNGKCSQETLAKRLGLSRTSIVNIEKGRQHPPLCLLWQIAEELETDLSDLIPTRQEYEQAVHGPSPLDDDRIQAELDKLEVDPAAKSKLSAWLQEKLQEQGAESYANPQQ